MEKSKISINMECGLLFCGGWNFLKSVSMGSTFIREMRVGPELLTLRSSPVDGALLVETSSRLKRIKY